MSGRAAVPAAAGAHACGGGQPAGYGQPAGCLSAWTLPPFPVIGPAAVPAQPGPVQSGCTVVGPAAVMAQPGPAALSGCATYDHPGQLAGRIAAPLLPSLPALPPGPPPPSSPSLPCPAATGCVAMPLAWAVQPRIAMPVHLRATAPAAAALALELSCSVRPATAHVARVTSPEVDFRLEAQQRALGVCPHRGSPLFTLPSLLPLPPPPALPPQVPQPDAVVDDELSTNYSLESDITCPLNDDYEHYLAREGQPIFGFTLNALFGKSGNEEYKAKVTLNLSDAGKKDISSIIFFCHKYNADILIKVLHGPVPQGCGLTSSETKPCFCRRVETDEFMSQYWHINDVLVATTSADLSDALYSYFTKTFPMKPLPMRDKPHLSLLLTPTSVGSSSCFLHRSSYQLRAYIPEAPASTTTSRTSSKFALLPQS